jgi:hypothetical protein
MKRGRGDMPSLHLLNRGRQRPKERASHNHQPGIGDSAACVQEAIMLQDTSRCPGSHVVARWVCPGSHDLARDGCPGSHDLARDGCPGSHDLARWVSRKPCCCKMYMSRKSQAPELRQSSNRPPRSDRAQQSRQFRQSEGSISLTFEALWLEEYSCTCTPPEGW